MHASRLFDSLHTGTKVEVVGVGEDNLCLDIIPQVAMKDTLDGCRSTYGHKNRSLDGAVRSLYFTRTGFGLWVGILQCKFHSGTKVTDFPKK